METYDNPLIKIDLLSVEALDKIHICLDLLLKDNLIEKKATLKETYENVIGIYNLERENKDMWKMIWNHEIQSLFQMEKESGIKGIATLLPSSVDELAILNSTIRLMAQEGEKEMPIDKLARFKNNKYAWLNEMKNFGLGEKEKNILEPILGISYGLCIAQEQFMELVQLKECGGFDLNFADRLRKSIAKKNPAEYEKLTKEYFEEIKKRGCNELFCDYVWNHLIAMSKGYGFNQSHTLAYSLIGLQEMNLCFKFPIVYWNCSCLISDSGSEGANTEYNKIAKAIGKIGVKVALPDINNSDFEFAPDVKNNQILYGLKGMVNIGDDLIEEIKNKRPYKSPKDFLIKINPNKQAMISLIKGGAFDKLEERKFVMAWYLWETCDKKKRITLQNINSLIKYNLLPDNTEEYIMARRIFEFNRYLKAKCKANNEFYTLDERCINFLNELDYNPLIKQNFDNNLYFIYIKDWDKIYQKWMDVFRTWIANNKENILLELNTKIFKDDWDKYAKGNLSTWEMESLCFYYHKHELQDVDMNKYGISDFNYLPKDPVIDRQFVKNNKTINIYKLYKICGTCIAKDKAKSSVSLLTTSGVVNVKFRKEYFSLFDKQISVKNSSGKKTVMEKSWFNRGSMILVNGMRSGEDFIVKKYSSTNGHQLYKIDEVNGTNIVLRNERYKGDLEEDEEL